MVSIRISGGKTRFFPAAYKLQLLSEKKDWLHKSIKCGEIIGPRTILNYGSIYGMKRVSSNGIVNPSVLENTLGRSRLVKDIFIHVCSFGDYI